MNYIQTNFGTVQDIFKEFNEAVKKDRETLSDTYWEKLPYTAWKEINKFLNAHKRIRLITIVEKNTNLKLFEDDGSFADDPAPFKPDQCLIIKKQEHGFSTFLLTRLKEIFPMATATSTYNTMSSSGDPLYTTNTITTNDGTNLWTTNTTSTWTTAVDPNYVTNTYGTGSVQITKDGITINGKKVLTEENKEDSMTNKDFGFNFDFGPVTDNTLAVCPFGIAAKNPDGGFCYYDPKEKKIVDCTPFTFDTKKFLFKMPVAVSAIAVGDVIMHRGFPMFVKGVEDEEGRIVAIDLAEAEEKYILPTRNMFGFNFVTKIVSLLDMKNSGANEANPFGNMLPLIMLMGDNKELDPMMLLMMNSGQVGSMNVFGDMAQNPLMMYMMMKDNKNFKDMLPFLMMTSTMPAQK